MLGLPYEIARFHYSDFCYQCTIPIQQYVGLAHRPGALPKGRRLNNQLINHFYLINLTPNFRWRFG